MGAEGWDLAHLVDLTRKAVGFCRRHDVPVMMVTEDTTRARPEHLKAIYRSAIEEGAHAICLSDTCGHATPAGVRNLVRFVKEEIVGSLPIRIDWHGHNDRGLGVANAIAAFEAGADQLHGSVLGIGERSGNVAMDQLLVNLSLMQRWQGDLTGLPSLAERVAELCGFSIPVNYPVLGRDAFRTATGVHAAAIVKALRQGDVALADAVYSGVPAALGGAAPGDRDRPGGGPEQRHLLAGDERPRSGPGPDRAHPGPREEEPSRPVGSRDRGGALSGPDPAQAFRDSTSFTRRSASSTSRTLSPFPAPDTP